MSRKSTASQTPAEKVNSVKKRQHLELVPAESGALGSMFLPEEAPLEEGMLVKSRSPMIKPINFPTNRRMRAILKALIPCIAGKGDNGKDKAGCLIELVPDLNSVGICLPATATLLGALEIKQEGEGKEAIFTTRFINHRVEIQKLSDKIPSKKGQDAWNFLVAVSTSPVV